MAKQGEDLGHPSQDKSLRCPLDKLLRDHGWTIHARPTGKPATWEKGEAVLTEAQALRTIPRHQVSDAEYAEALRLEGYE